MAQVQVLYVGTASGLYQLANPGASDRWRLVGEALAGQAVLAISTSATDPLAALAATAAGNVATADGGASWAPSADALPADAQPAPSLALAGLPATTLTATVDGLERAEGAGPAAAVAGPAGVTVLVSPPRLVDQVYAGTSSGELWLSKDRGRTWAKLREGLPPIHALQFVRVQS